MSQSRGGLDSTASQEASDEREQVTSLDVFLADVKEFKTSYHQEEATLFTTYPCYVNSVEAP